MQGFIDALATIEVGEDAVRLFHGRGGHYAGCEHLCLDWFAPVLLLTSFIQLEEAELADCQQAITARWQALQPNRPLNLVYQYRCGGETFSQLLTGEVPEQHIVTENRAKLDRKSVV